MKNYGKKQIDIREDNKSAVIDILLQNDSTMLQMSEVLKLSHTALAKVIKELTQKNIVMLTDVKEVNAGRPPKVYGINSDCAIACAVVLTSSYIKIYYVDMKGFQINECKKENDFSDLDSLLNFVAEKIRSLKAHPRLENKLLKYIYLGIPTAKFYGRTFEFSQQKVFDYMSSNFPEIGIVIHRNIDYETVAEQKYGLLKENISNAMLVNLDNYFSASILLNGSVYSGDTQMQGVNGFNEFAGIENIFDMPFDEIARGYCAKNEHCILEVRKKLDFVFERLNYILRFLDIGKVVLSGKVKMFGEDFLAYVSNMLQGCKVKYSIMGKEVPPALSGAVWMSTYATLQDVMVR